MSEKIEFQAVIEDAGKGGAYVSIPFDVEQVYGKKRVKVKALISGEEYRGSLVRMGTVCHILGVSKAVRERIGKTIGELVDIVLEEDTEPRSVAIPSDLRQALESYPEAAAAFQQLSYSHQREYVRWIDEARREQTRLKRIQQAVQMLVEKKPR